ncbi:MAG: hypothetical protein HY461_00610 [Parcubacteria group bacterium]|nr:hypothetical protein [Parcubacteria group bacterium]
MGIFVTILSFLTALAAPVSLPVTSPVEAIDAKPAVVEVPVVEPLSAAVAPSCPARLDDATTKRVLGLLYENAQGSIQPVLITDGKHTREMKKSFTTFKNSLGKELASLLREPKVITMDREMTILGDAFSNGINASGVRNKLQMFDENIKLVVYTDFVFSPFNHREPTGVYFRSQFGTLNQRGGSELYNRQMEANFLMWMAYTNL